MEPLLLFLGVVSVSVAVCSGGLNEAVAELLAKLSLRALFVNLVAAMLIAFILAFVLKVRP